MGVDNAVARAKLMGELDRLGKPQETIFEDVKMEDAAEGPEGTVVSWCSSFFQTVCLKVVLNVEDCLFW